MQIIDRFTASLSPSESLAHKLSALRYARVTEIVSTTCQLAHCYHYRLLYNVVRAFSKRSKFQKMTYRETYLDHIEKKKP